MIISIIDIIINIIYIYIMDNYRYKYKKYKMKYKQQIASGKETKKIQNEIQDINEKKTYIEDHYREHYRKSMLDILDYLLHVNNQLLKLNQSWMPSKRTKLEKEKLTIELAQVWDVYYQLEKKRVVGAKMSDKVKEIKNQLDYDFGNQSIDYHKSKLLNEIAKYNEKWDELNDSEYSETQGYEVEIKEIENRIDVLWQEKMEREEELENSQIVKDIRRETKDKLLIYGNMINDTHLDYDWYKGYEENDILEEVSEHLKHVEDKIDEEYTTPWDIIAKGLKDVKGEVDGYIKMLKKKNNFGETE